MTLIRKACFVMHICVHFLSRERKRNQKKPPVPRSLLRVGTADGARRNSLALRQADALIPSAPPMLGAAQRENRKIRMESILEGDTAPAADRKLSGNRRLSDGKGIMVLEI